MIRFEIEKLRVEHMYVKQVSSALGGMITVLDKKRSKKKEVFKKIKIPHQVARYFKKRYETVKYLKPVLTAVTFYGDHVVSLERHPLGNLGKEKTMGLFGDVEWISDSEHNLDHRIVPLNQMHDYFFDGTFLYTVEDKDLNAAVSLSADGRFKAVKVKAIKLMHISEALKLEPEERTALAFMPAGRKMFLTPPIWKTLNNVGAQQLKNHKKAAEEVEEDDSDDYSYSEIEDAGTFKFDQVDEYLGVNLGFALKAGRTLSDLFGYDVVEPLCFDDLMIQMRTVNLPQIANEVKQTYDTGFPFTYAVAWLIGLTNRTKTLESFIMLRTLLKHLTTKGVYRKGAFASNQIFKDVNVVDVPLKTLAQASDVGKVDQDTAFQMGRISRSDNDGDEDITAGGLYDAT